MERPHKTMDKKLIINVAPTGSFMNRQQNPGQPYTMEENVKAAIEALQGRRRGVARPRARQGRHARARTRMC